MRAAEQLFLQRGYHAVSITDIITAAGVTKPTLYYHYADKAELFVHMALQMLRRIHAAIDVALADETRLDRQLEALTKALWRTSSGDTRMMRRELQTHLSMEHQQQVAAAFQQHMLAPITQVMQDALDRRELVRHSAPELALLFLGLVEAFQPTEAAVHTAADATSSSVSFVTAKSVVDLFLHGVDRRGRRKPTNKTRRT